MSTYSCKNRKHVYEILKKEYGSFVVKAIEKIKSRKKKLITTNKKETAQIKEENFQVKVENDHNHEPLKIEEQIAPIHFDLTSEEIYYYNSIFQNHMSFLYINDFFANMNFNSDIMMKNWVVEKQADLMKPFLKKEE